MRKYWTIFRVVLENNLMYRGHAFVWMLFDLLWIGVFPFIWFFIINAQGGEIQGWNNSAIIVYYVFMAVLSNIVLMHPEAHMAYEIYEGKFSNYVIKPHSYLLYVFLHESAYKMVRFLAFIPFAVPLIWAIQHFGGSGAVLPQLPFIILATLLAMPIFFLVAAIIGMTCFWLEDSYAARTIFWASSGLFGGQYAPFELMPPILNTVASALPFKYAIYFPLRLISQQVPRAEMLRGLGIQLVWIAALFVLSSIIWKKGLKRYSAVGR
ncbi:ABC-2 family transporter protein [Candidatus Uhrbacteria bacterium]|nr:ABC-2 family transporter protein [Candidatus Uhrbacteria bacterium]